MIKLNGFKNIFLDFGKHLFITEVDVKNERSMNAHKAVGFKELSRHSSDGREWSLIILKNKKATF